MLIGVSEYVLFLPLCHSLKDKRSLIKSLLSRLQNKFNVSVCEADYHDLWQKSLIGVAVVSNQQKHVDNMLLNITNFIEGFSSEIEIVQIHKEIL